MRSTGFHVRHDLQPALTAELLTLLQASPTGQSEKSIHSGAQARGYKLRHRKDYGKLLNSLNELGIVMGSKSQLRLTDIGTLVVRMTAYDTDLLPSFVHFLYYTAFDANSDKRFSWSYKTICGILWETAPCVINRDRLVNQVIDAATEQFHTTDVSFSTSSLAGITNWLEALRPACIDNRNGTLAFKRRDYCSIELFALALNHFYRAQATENLRYIPITDQLRDQVCRLCLIVPEAFPDILSETKKMFEVVQVRHERGDMFAMNGFTWESLEV